MHCLHVARLTLTDFRNHAALDLQLDARPVCLFGPNGAGKTNILEALTMLAPGRGLRGASLTDVARAGERRDARAAVGGVGARACKTARKPRSAPAPSARRRAASSAWRAAMASPRPPPNSPKPRA